MFNRGKLLSIIFKNNIKPNFKINIQLVNLIHNTLFNNIKTYIKVNDYLLNRNIPATDILNSLTDEDAKTLEKIKCEYSHKLANNEIAPNQIRDKDYLLMLTLSNNQRQKYYVHLADKELRKINKKPIETFKLDPIYSTYTKQLKSLSHGRLRQAIVLKHQEIVFDFSYEDEMLYREVKALVKQIEYCYSRNKMDDEPYQMIFVNLNPNSVTHDLMRQYFVKPDEQSIIKRLEDYPFTMSDKHYLDLYPNRRIVYLSPNSNNFFQEGEYDHDAIYIIGGLVELCQIKPLTLARAKKEGLEHRALPIDRYLSWKFGTKELTLNQVLNALTVARNTNGDWGKALKENIPIHHFMDL